jgi:hypothetical protein
MADPEIWNAARLDANYVALKADRETLTLRALSTSVFRYNLVNSTILDRATALSATPWVCGFDKQ